MQEQCVIAEYRSRQEARTALEVLETYHFTTDTVSVASHKDDPAIRDLHAHENEVPDNVPGDKGTGLGALVGGTVAAPIAVSTMVGPFFLVGPLAGMAAGAVVGGLLSNPYRGGLKEPITKSYEQRVEEGSILVIVHGDPTRLDEAERGLATTKPTSLERFSYPRTAAPPKP